MERKEIELRGGNATIFMGVETETGGSPARAAPNAEGCPNGPYNHFNAHVYLGDSVVSVSAPGASGGPDGPVESPYDTLEGIEAVVRALQPYQPAGEVVVIPAS